MDILLLLIGALLLYKSTLPSLERRRLWLLLVVGVRLTCLCNRLASMVKHLVTPETRPLEGLMTPLSRTCESADRGIFA